MIRCKLVKTMAVQPPCGSDQCCFYCDKKNECKDSCPDIDLYKDAEEDCDQSEAVNDEKKELVTLESAVPTELDELTKACIIIKKQEEKKKLLQDQIKDAMVKNGIKSFKNDYITIAYRGPSKRSGFDSKKFKLDHPDLAEEYTTESDVSDSITIKVL